MIVDYTYLLLHHFDPLLTQMLYTVIDVNWRLMLIGRFGRLLNQQVESYQCTSPTYSGTDFEWKTIFSYTCRLEPTNYRVCLGLQTVH